MSMQLRQKAIRSKKAKQLRKEKSESSINKELSKSNKALDRFKHTELNDEINYVLEYIKAAFGLSECSNAIYNKVKLMLTGEVIRDGQKVLTTPIPYLNLIDFMDNYYSEQIQQANKFKEEQEGFFSIEGKVLYDLTIVISHYKEYEADRLKTSRMILDEEFNNDQLLR